MKLFIHKPGLYSYRIFKGGDKTLLFSVRVDTGWGQTDSLEMYDLNNKLVLQAKSVHSGSLWEWSPKKYNLTLFKDGQQHFNLERINIWRQHWTMTGQHDHYDYHDHGWCLRSVFKQGMQIAAADQEFSFFEEKSVIHMDSTEDPIIVAGLILTLDIRAPKGKNGRKSGVGSLLGILARRYDTTWRPK